jgi:hypothetical protein
MKLFSAFAAATLLERDRQTVARALRNVAQDGADNGQPRWKLATIVAALERNSDSGTAVRTTTRTAGTACRLNELADEIEHLHHQLDAAVAKVKSIPNVAAKQPHSRAAMKLIERIDELYTECNAILREIDPTSLAPMSRLGSSDRNSVNSCPRSMAATWCWTASGCFLRTANSATRGSPMGNGHDLADYLESAALEAVTALRLVTPGRDWLDEILDADGDGLTSSSAAYIADVSTDTIGRRADAAASTDRPLGILMAGAVWLISLRRLLDSIELRDGLPARLAAQSSR